jgi:hypothetical protein
MAKTELRETGLTEHDASRENSLCKRRWRKLSFVFRGAYLLRKNKAQVVESIDELIEDVRHSPTLIGRSRSRSTIVDAIDEHRRNEQLFEAIMRGGRLDCIEIGRILDDDPKRYMHSRTDPDALQNRANSKGLRPIYEASKFGNLDVVRLLFGYGADPRLTSAVSDIEHENALDVACRWGHGNVVGWLLGAAKWTKQELRSAANVCMNSELQRAVKAKIPSSNWLACCSRKR